MKKTLFILALGLFMFSFTTAKESAILVKETSTEEIIFGDCFDRADRVEQAFCGFSGCNDAVFELVLGDCIING